MELNEILVGIDKDEIESPFGWWETSTGAEFGKKKLEEVKAAVQRLTEAAYQRGLNKGRREGFGIGAEFICDRITYWYDYVSADDIIAERERRWPKEEE